MSAPTKSVHRVCGIAASSGCALALAGSLGGFAESARAASTPRDSVWIGAAIDGRWPTNPYSHPSQHHTFRYSNAGVGDWGFDQIGVTRGQRVYVYAAPQDTGLNKAIRAKIQSVSPICARRKGESVNAQLARGGSAVVVAIYSGTTKVGAVTYGHVQPTVRAGDPVSRWGGQIGTIGQYQANGCWDGVHLHMELYNEARYACYNGAFSAGAPMRRTNYIGYLGGAFASAAKKPCPRGI